MICEHLQVLDQELKKARIKIVYENAKPWSKNCRSWNRYDCYLDLKSIRARLKLADCVKDHIYKDNWNGEERGFVCDDCNDAIIGNYEHTRKTKKFT